MKTAISNLVNSEVVLNTFVNLKFRWEDEYHYEDFNNYAEVMLKRVKKVLGDDVKLMKGMKRPFGIVFTFMNRNHKLFLKTNGRSYWLACALV